MYKAYFGTFLAVCCTIGYTAVTEQPKATARPIQDELYWCDSKGINCVLVPDYKTIDEMRMIEPIAFPPLGAHIAASQKEIRCLAQNIQQEAGGASVHRSIVGGVCYD